MKQIEFSLRAASRANEAITDNEKVYAVGCDAKHHRFKFVIT